ncbi:MAG: hypothetical protein M3Y09_13710 [Actinomycetota bacterium]|nr:hypothetical protein [Actinomycetota bacterium]
MYGETDHNGRRAPDTVAQIAAEFGVNRPTIHGHRKDGGSNRAGSA